MLSRQSRLSCLDRGFPSSDFADFGFILKDLPTEKTISCQEQGMHNLRCFSMLITSERLKT
jgi:hypothetical protein